MNIHINNVDRNPSYRVMFSPLFLFLIKRSERFLSDMEQQGWALFKVRFGCLLYFMPCKPKKDSVYYMTQFSKYRFREIAGTYGKKALKESFSERVIKRSEFFSFKVNGLGYSKMYFTIYRFNDNQETINSCKKKRFKDNLSYLWDIILYICVNILTPLLLIYYLIQKIAK